MSDYELILFGIAALLIVLFVHELGHLLMARYFGVRVLGLSVGLGPELIGFKDQFGTRWSLSAIPFGAYLKMYDEKRLSIGNASAAPVKNYHRKSHSLSSCSHMQKAAIYGAGSAANILFAMVIYIIGAIYFWGTLSWPSDIELNAGFVLIFCYLNFINGISNLLPVPYLDGWKLMGLAWESFGGMGLLEAKLVLRTRWPSNRAVN